MKYLSGINLQGKTFLELGAGSGLISFSAEKAGASVTSTDINKTAIVYLEKNREYNNSSIRIIRSDLFNDIPRQQFDFIVINPPYYKKQPTTELEHAWYCGEHGEYFERLFSGIKPYMHSDTNALIILSDDGDIQMVKDIAVKHQCLLALTDQKNMLLETNFIYRIIPQ
jgi:release factor glutamine methyltransferase